MQRWTKEQCVASALRYSRRSDWSKGDQAAYAAAKRAGWFDTCVTHMVGNKQWSEAECFSEAKRFSSPGAWKKGSYDSYAAARHNKWSEACSAHMNKVNVEWTLDKCKAIAAAYAVCNHWKRGHHNSYSAAYRNNWLEECCAHMDKQEFISFQECKTNAANFATRSDWRDADKASYRAAQRNKWSELCTEHMGSPHTISSVEGRVFEYVQSICPDAVRGERTILGGKFEIDIFVPSLMIGIEFNGLEWHCDKRNRKLDYHQTKTNVAAGKGVTLVHIWSDEWRNKEEVVKGYLRRLLQHNVKKVLARRCDIVSTTGAEQRNFLDANHIQGTCGGNGFALVHDGETVAVGLAHTNRAGENELVRWCVKMDTDVVGGFSKVVSRLGGNLITFCDTTKFSGKSYSESGWTLLKRSPAVVFYTNKSSDRRINRDSFKKADMAATLTLAGINFDPLASEVELAGVLGFNRIAGCELLKFGYNL